MEEKMFMKSWVEIARSPDFERKLHERGGKQDSLYYDAWRLIVYGVILKSECLRSNRGSIIPTNLCAHGQATYLIHKKRTKKMSPRWFCGYNKCKM